MRQTFRLVHETARENAIKAILRATIGAPRPTVVTVQPEEKRRSTDQNARYWAVLQNAALSSGMDAEELHWVAKKKFLGYREVEFNGDIHEIPNSTAKLNTEKFSAYCNQVEAWLAQEGLLSWV